MRRDLRAPAGRGRSTGGCRALTTVTAATPLVLADLTNRNVLGLYGIAGDVSTGTDYASSQRWAHRLWEAGFDGVYYATRHDPQLTERSVAVFGNQGDEAADEQARLSCTTTPLPDDLLHELMRLYRIVVMPAADLSATELGAT